MKKTTEDDVIVELLCELAEQDAQLATKDRELVYVQSLYEEMAMDNEDLEQRLRDAEDADFNDCVDCIW